ncbi:MAG: hypothetical protein AB7K63_20150 [Vicinamibacterales bacterium]
MTDTHQRGDIEVLRLTYGFRIVVGGLALVGVVFGLAVVLFEGAADVTAVVGSVSGVVGTVVGAFFGLQVGAAGKDKAEDDKEHALRQRDVAQLKVERLLTVAPREEAIRVLKDLQ